MTNHHMLTNIYPKNQGRNKQICKAIILLLFVFNTTTIDNSHAQQLPDLGSESRSIMSPRSEVIIGKAWLASLRATGMVSYDPIINTYLNKIGQRLAAYAEIKDFPLKFFAVRDDSFNAFAFFGGNVGINEGLISATNNENELAAVMAHEIAHIAQAHMLRQLAKQRQLLPITMAESLAAIATGNPDLILPILAGHSQQMINYSREHEQEADRCGIQILAKAGFDPQSMPNVFQNMSQKSRYDYKPPEYLSTHPMYDSRIVDARHRADSFKYQQSPSSLTYYLVKARIKALSHQNSHDKIEDFKQQLNSKRYENAIACEYGYAMALMLNHEYKAAQSILNKLEVNNPSILILQLALAENEALGGNNNKAIARMEKLLAAYPEDLTLNLQYAEQMLAKNNPLAAKKCLLKIKSIYKDEPMIYYQLARIESTNGNKANMYEANSEWHLLHGDYQNCLMQLELAEQTTTDPQQKIRIQQRQVQVKELVEQQRKI